MRIRQGNHVAWSWGKITESNRTDPACGQSESVAINVTSTFDIVVQRLENNVSSRSLTRLLTDTRGLSSAVHTCASHTAEMRAFLIHCHSKHTSSWAFFAAVASRYISDQCMRTYSMFFPGTHTCKALSVGRDMGGRGACDWPVGMGGAWSDSGGSLISSSSSRAPGPTWTYPSLGTRLHYGWTLHPSLHELVKEKERTQKNTERNWEHIVMWIWEMERKKETIQQAQQMLTVF